MRRKNLEISAYWKERGATLKQCTHTFLDFLRKLKTYQSTFFGTWYGAGRSKKEVLSNRITFEYECIKKEFSKKEKEDKFPEFTYNGFVGNAKEDCEHMHISVALGGVIFNNINNCIINLPKGGAIYDYFEEPLHQLALIRLVIDHWNPDFICIHDYKKDTLPPFTDEKILKAIKENVIYFKI